MTPWFEARYPDPTERATKFEVFMLIAEYLAEYREQLDAARLVVMGSDSSGDLVSGVVANLLLNHFRVLRTTPYPEQVIRAAKKHIDARNNKSA